MHTTDLMIMFALLTGGAIAIGVLPWRTRDLDATLRALAGVRGLLAGAWRWVRS